MKTVGKIVKITLIVLLFSVIGFFVWRIIYVHADSTLGQIIPTEGAVAAYENGGEFLTNPIHDTISGTEKDGADGLFTAYNFVYIPQAREVQVTVRANDSSIERLGLTEMPYFFLKIYTGYHYEDEEHDIAVRECVRYEDDHKLMYNYRRLVFSDVDIGPENDLLVTVSGDGTSAGGVSELVIHFREQKLEEYKLSRADKKALDSVE